MKLPIKQVLVKEGLILLGIVLISAIIIFSLTITEFAIVGEQTGQKIVTLAFILMFLGYPIYFLFRLIIRAIMTIKSQ